MLSLSSKFEGSRSIKVLVVPIGNNKLFDSHFQVVSRLGSIPLYEIDSSKLSKTFFKGLNWNQGELFFEYLRYDRVAYGPGDLNNFQSSRRILMIMGLINYPELEDSSQKIEEELDYFAKRHPNIILKRLFVFNYPFDESSTPQKELPNDPNSLIIFPPDGLCEGGSMVDVHLNEVMSHAALKIITSLDKQMELCEEAKLNNTIPSHLPLTSIFDDIDDNITKQESGISLTRSKRAYRKRPIGRIRKWMGDLSLQVCSPLDAIESYSIAINECRSLGDNLWLAGSLEGYAMAIFLLIKMKFSLNELIGKDLRTITSHINSTGDLQLDNIQRGYILAEERMNEAISIYSRNVMFCGLEVECLIRLAKIIENRENLIDKNEKVLHYIMRSLSVPGLNAQQQVECTIEAALICHRLGLKRKYALFLFLGSLICADNENYAVAHALMLYSCKIFGLTQGYENQSPIDIINCFQGYSISFHSYLKDFLSEMDSTNFGWPNLLASILSNGALISKEHGDIKTTSRFVSTLVDLLQESESYQLDIRNKWLEASHKQLGFQDSSSQTSKSDLESKMDQRRSTLISMENEIPKKKIQITSSLELSNIPNLASSPKISNLSIQLDNQKASNIFSPSLSSSFEQDKQLASKHMQNNLSISSPYDKMDVEIGQSNNYSTMVSKKGLKDNEFLSTQEFNDLYHSSISASSIIDQNFLSPASENPSEVKLRMFSVPSLPHKLNSLLNKKFNISQVRKNELLEYSKNRKQYDSITELLFRTVHSESNPSQSESLSSLGNSFRPLDISHALDIFDSWNSLISDYSYPVDQQFEILELFNSLSKLVSPNKDFKLPVYLKSLKPFRLRSYKRPHLVSEDSVKMAKDNFQTLNSKIVGSESSLAQTMENSSKSSVLFYDPFEARRKKMTVKPPEIVYWSVGAECTIEAVLSNFLSVPLKLNDVKVICKGLKHHSYPKSILVPPQSKHFKIALKIKPLEIGSLEICGLSISMNNFTQNYHVDSKGNCTDERLLRLSQLHKHDLPGQGVDTNQTKVVENMPDINIDFSSRNLFSSKACSLEDIDREIYVDLFPGEVRCEILSIKSQAFVNSRNFNTGFVNTPVFCKDCKVLATNATDSLTQKCKSLISEKNLLFSSNAPSCLLDYSYHLSKVQKPPKDFNDNYSVIIPHVKYSHESGHGLSGTNEINLCLQFNDLNGNEKLESFDLEVDIIPSSQKRKLEIIEMLKNINEENESHLISFILENDIQPEVFEIFCQKIKIRIGIQQKKGITLSEMLPIDSHLNPVISEQVVLDTFSHFFNPSMFPNVSGPNLKIVTIKQKQNIILKVKNSSCNELFLGSSLQSIRNHFKDGTAVKNIENFSLLSPLKLNNQEDSIICKIEPKTEKCIVMEYSSTRDPTSKSPYFKLFWAMRSIEKKETNEYLSDTCVRDSPQFEDYTCKLRLGKVSFSEDFYNNKKNPVRNSKHLDQFEFENHILNSIVRQVGFIFPAFELYYIFNDAESQKKPLSRYSFASNSSLETYLFRLSESNRVMINLKFHINKEYVKNLSSNALTLDVAYLVANNDSPLKKSMILRGKPLKSYSIDRNLSLKDEDLSIVIHDQIILLASFPCACNLYILFKLRSDNSEKNDEEINWHLSSESIRFYVTD